MVIFSDVQRTRFSSDYTAVNTRSVLLVAEFLELPSPPVLYVDPSIATKYVKALVDLTTFAAVTECVSTTQ